MGAPSLLLAEGNYTVVKKDNLWNLAAEHLGDAYNWKAIWDKNSFISDPHWIYPGDELFIPGISELPMATEITLVDTTKTYSELTAGLFSDDESKEVSSESGKYQASHVLEGFENGGKNIFTHFAKRLSPYVSTKRNSDDVITDGVGEVLQGSRHVYAIYKKVAIRSFDNFAFEIGKRYDIVEKVEIINSRDEVIGVFKPVGTGTIQDISGDTASLFLSQVWGVVKEGNFIIEVEQFNEPVDADKIIKIDSLEASITKRINRTVVIMPGEEFIIDRGSEDGVQRGDIFNVHEFDKKEKDKFYHSMKAVAVRVNEKHATVSIFGVTKEVLHSNLRFKRTSRILFK